METKNISIIGRPSIHDGKGYDGKNMMDSNREYKYMEMNTKEENNPV
jgi:hypothetical protein